MDGHFILKRDNPQVATLQLGNFAPEPVPIVLTVLAGLQTDYLLDASVIRSLSQYVTRLITWKQFRLLGGTMSEREEQSRTASAQPRLLDRVRDGIRIRHYSRRTEETYVHWIKRFIYFSGKRHPAEMAAEEVTAFLNHLASERNVAAATQKGGRGVTSPLDRAGQTPG